MRVRLGRVRSGSIAAAQRFSSQRLRDHRVDLGGVEGALVMIDLGVREREHYRLVLLDDRERFLTAVLDEGGTARVGAADDPGEGISSVEVTLYELRRARPT
jgi:hypothetical protein